MHYVAVDPSPIHTAFAWWGVALNGKEYLDTYTFTICEAQRHLRNRLVGIRDGKLPLTIIIERPPQTPRGATIESQQTIAAYWMLTWLAQEIMPLAKIISIAPGSWKPAAKGWGIEYPSTLTDQHQRDAYAMLQVHLATKGAKR
jgi:hypothetical protein